MNLAVFYNCVTSLTEKVEILKFDIVKDDVPAKLQKCFQQSQPFGKSEKLLH